MNARELLEEYRERCTRTPREMNDTDYAVVMAALSLLAAAEANDGKTPETDAYVATWTSVEGDDPDDLEFMERMERSRNGLAAEVGRLKEDAERLRFQYSCYVKTCAAVNLGGAMTYDKWVAAIDAERAGK